MSHSLLAESWGGAAGFAPSLCAAGPSVERRRQLSHREFLREYAKANRPVIITDALGNWPALGKWTPGFFAARSPRKRIKFKDGSELLMKEFIDRVSVSSAANPAPYWTNAPLDEHFPDLMGDIDPRLVYFEPNWGARRYLHKGMQASLQRGATIEIYIGGEGGSFPILHWDGLSTHAFLMQIYGRKRYYVWPPEDTPFMYASEETPNVSPIRDVQNPDLEKYPLFAKAHLSSFVLEPGEMLFMPSRWWHTAKMLTPSITLSINTVNSSNWANFTEDMTRKAGSVGRLMKRAYLMASMCVNEVVDLWQRTN
jgi:hypothetical protein